MPTRRYQPGDIESSAAPVPNVRTRRRGKDFTPKPVGRVKPSKPEPRFFFVDLETTGLNHFNDAILEVAILVTDVDLEMIDAKAWIISLAAAPRWEDWSTEAYNMHQKSGLIEECRHGSMVGQIETEAVEFLNRYGEVNKFPMCGSSVHFDRRMLMQQMPMLESWFHYRNIDISSIKEMVRVWAPDKNAPYIRPEDKAHRGLQDLNASIEELRHYRRVLGLDPLPAMTPAPEPQ